jgi:hypothetical protein
MTVFWDAFEFRVLELTGLGAAPQCTTAAITRRYPRLGSGRQCPTE